jgi:hypothetical protein
MLKTPPSHLPSKFPTRRWYEKVVFPLFIERLLVAGIQSLTLENMKFANIAGVLVAVPTW